MVDNSLVLLVRTSVRTQRLYRIQIRWSQSASQGSSNFQFSPEIIISSMKIALSDAADLQLAPELAGGLSQIQPQLSHLELIPVAMQGLSTEPSALTVVMVFSHLSEPPQADYQDSFSIVARWEIHGTQLHLPSQMDALGLREMKDNTMVSGSGLRCDVGGWLNFPWNRLTGR